MAALHLQSRSRLRDRCILALVVVAILTHGGWQLEEVLPFVRHCRPFRCTWRPHQFAVPDGVTAASEDDAGKAQKANPPARAVQELAEEVKTHIGDYESADVDEVVKVVIEAYGNKQALEKATWPALESIVKTCGIKSEVRKVAMADILYSGLHPPALASVQPGASSAQAPSDRIVTKSEFRADLMACQRPAGVIVNRPGMVLVEESANANFLDVVEGYEAISTDSYRVGPLMLSRCARGGKTTALVALFDKLQSDGYPAIFMTFNGAAGFRRKPNESLLDAFLRVLASAIMDQKPDDINSIKCSKAEITDYFEGKDAILLIDELNVLIADDSDTELGLFLRQCFLDCKKRYMVFTTHWPLYKEARKSIQLLEDPSPRDIVVGSILSPTSLEQMQRMEGCDAITGCEAAYYSNLPALIYSVIQQKYDIRARFAEVNLPPSVDDSLRAAFIAEFLSGRAGSNSPLRMFDRLTVAPATQQVKYVLAFVEDICFYLGFHGVAKLVQTLAVRAGSTRAGKEWETVISLGLAFRCLDFKFNGVVHPWLNVDPTAQQPVVFTIRALPDRIVNTDQAVEYWETKVDVRQFPCIEVLLPVNSLFTKVDMILVYRESAQSQPQYTGFQTKNYQKTKAPDTAAPDGMCSVWLSGRGTPADQPQYPDWLIPTAEELREFLGASLKDLHPGSQVP